MGELEDYKRSLKEEELVLKSNREALKELEAAFNKERSRLRKNIRICLDNRKTLGKSIRNYPSKMRRSREWAAKNIGEAMKRTGFK